MSRAIELTTLRKLNLKIIPVVMICYFIANLDKTNISIAALQMNADLKLTAAMYGIGVSMFYVTYIIFEIPSNVILTKVGPRIWIARIMITWGIISSLMAFVHTPGQLYVLRLLLGAAEAGFTPGIIYYLSCWFPKTNRARAMSFFYIGSVGASVVGLPIGGMLLNLHGALGLVGWRWLFFLEGIPAVILGIYILFRLVDHPGKAKWLKPAEASWLTTKLEEERSNAQIGEHEAWYKALGNPIVLALAAVWFFQAFSSIGIILFMPLILKSIAPGRGSTVIGLLSALPFLAAGVFMYFNGRHSDKTGERSLHLGLPVILAGICMATAVYSPALLGYVLLVLTVGLTFALTPVFWAVTTERIAGVAAAASIALINTVANFVGLGLPPVLGRIKDATGSYDAGLLIIATALVLSGVIGILVTRNHGAVVAAAAEAGAARRAAELAAGAGPAAVGEAVVVDAEQVTEEGAR